MKILSRSIFLKIFFALFFLIVIIFSINLYLTYYYQREQLENQLIEHQQLLISHVVNEIETDYTKNQWPFESLRSLEESKNIMFWLIVEPDGKIYQSSDPMIWGKKIEGEPQLVKDQVFDSFYPETKEKIKVIVQPIKLFEPGWKFYAVISLQEIDLALRSFLTYYLFLFFYLAALSALVIALIVSAIVFPLESFTRTIQKIAETNDLSKKITIKTKDEIGILANAFNQMLASLQRLEKTKTELISLMAHQLRTPCSIISWHTEMLLSADLVRTLNEKQKSYLQTIHQNNQRLIALINNLLNVSRIEMGKLVINPRSTDLIKLIKQSLKDFNLQIKAKRIETEEHYDQLSIIIKVDPNLMQIVFDNLFSNAIKYIPFQGKINLRVEKRKTDILISIQDTGCGIPKEQQPMIFTKLFRADNARKYDTKGTGLGLYIVKHIIEEGGGKIWFESEENKGTTFYLTLPLEGMRKKAGAELIFNN